MNIADTLQEYGAIGKDNAIPTGELLQLCGIHSRRYLVQVIADERAAGALICSKATGRGGYYLPSCDEEIIVQKKALESRIIKHALALRPFRRRVKEIKKAVKGGKGNE